MNPQVPFVLAASISCPRTNIERPTLLNCFSTTLLTSTPFLPGQWAMSPRQEDTRIGGSTEVNKKALEKHTKLVVLRQDKKKAVPGKKPEA